MGLFWGCQGESGGEGVSGVYWGWKELYVLRGQKGYSRHSGLLRSVGSVKGQFGGVRGHEGCRGVFGVASGLGA